jgi:hypothetical protein
MDQQRDKVADFTGAPWSKQAVEKLTELWREGVPPKVISATLRRGEETVRAKAAELHLLEPSHQ